MTAVLDIKPASKTKNRPSVFLTSRIYNFAERVLNPDPLKMPVTLEIHPTNFCNNSCCFCSSSAILANNQKPSLPTEALLTAINDFADGGGMSIVLSGGGEPTLHPDFKILANEITKRKIQFGVITNGLLMDAPTQEALSQASWVKFSLNGANAEHYERQTGIKDPRVFDRIAANIKKFIAEKSDRTIASTSMIVTQKIQSNEDITLFYDYSVHSLGVDYALFRPYLGQDASLKITRDKDDLKNLAKQLGDKATQDCIFTNFAALPRDMNGVRRVTEGQCPITQAGLIGMISGLGDVGLCLPLVRDGHKEMALGSITERSFKDIWQDQHHKDVLAAQSNLCCPTCKYEKMVPKIEDMRNDRSGHIMGTRLDPHWCFL